MHDIGFSDKAKLEINVNKLGVYVVANAEGYLALARWCTQLAELHSGIRAEPQTEDTDTIDAPNQEYHLSMEITRDAITKGRYIFVSGAVEPYNPDNPESDVPDVFFCVSDQIGEGFWKGRTATGMSAEMVSEYAAFSSYSAFDQIEDLSAEGTKEALDELMQFVNGDDLVDKLYAIGFLYSFSDVPEARTLLLQLADDPDSAVRRYAIDVLANWFEGEDIKQAISAKLEDADPLVRTAARQVLEDFNF